jgi:ABC-type transporter MlaC component
VIPHPQTRSPGLTRTAIAVLLLTFALTHPPAHAAEDAQPPAPGAERAVDRLSDRLVTIAGDASKDTAARERALAKTLRGAMDFETLAPFVLGRHAADLDAAQRRSFRRTFADYVVATYARVLARHAIAEMEVVQSRRVTPHTAAVATRVARRQGEADRWIWRLHRRNSGGWAVVDLQTPSASLAVNYRSEFGHLLDQRGFDALIQQIRSHTERDAILPAENRAILMLIRGLQADRLALTAQ